MVQRSNQAVSASELRQVSRSQIPLLNIFHGNRLPLTFTVDGRPAALSFGSPGAATASSDVATIELRYENETLSIAIDRALFTFLMAAFDDALAAGEPSPTHAALALETLLADSLEKLEKRIGSPVGIVGVETGGETASEQDLNLPLDIVIEGFGSSQGTVGMSGSAARRLAQTLRSAPRAVIGTQDIKFPVVACVASSHLTADEVARLAPGDVILVERICESPAKPFALIADTLVYPAVFNARGLRIEGPASRASGSPQEWCMEQQSENMNGGPALDAEISQLPVKITFELGRIELSLEDVQALGQGTVIPLEKPLDQALDIMANGRRIGRGTIVKIGESIGVEVTRITSGK